MSILTPTDYFEQIKDNREKTSDPELLRMYDSTEFLLQKYAKTGQYKAAEKLLFIMDCLTKEREAVKIGIDTFVYRESITEFIQNVEGGAVKIIELEAYQREIPDEVLEKLMEAKKVFNRFFVVFTDYTGEAEKQVAEEKRDRDPILFATFQDLEVDGALSDRFYFIGDWIDEYCDLTFDEFVKESHRLTGESPERFISTPKSIDDIRNEISRYRENPGGFKMIKRHRPESFFTKVKRVFGR